MNNHIEFGGNEIYEYEPYSDSESDLMSDDTYTEDLKSYVKRMKLKLKDTCFLGKRCHMKYPAYITSEDPGFFHCAGCDKVILNENDEVILQSDVLK
jgi:hypothetical protein